MVCGGTDIRIADLQITLDFHFILLVRNLELARRVGLQVKRREKMKARSSNSVASCQCLESVQSAFARGE
jgi:hypothetical protein